MASVQTGIRPALSSPYQATTAVAELVSCNSTRSPGQQAGAQQPGGHGIRAGVEFAIGEPRVRRDQRRAAGVGRRGLAEGRGEGARAPGPGRQVPVHRSRGVRDNPRQGRGLRRRDLGGAVDDAVSGLAAVERVHVLVPLAFVIPGSQSAIATRSARPAMIRVDEIVDVVGGGADHREQLGLAADPLGEREPVEQRRTAWSSLQPDPVCAGLGECEAAVEHLVCRRRPGIIDICSQHRRQGLVRIGRPQGGDGQGLTWHLAIARLRVFSQDAAAGAQCCPFVGPVQDPGPDVGELVVGGCQAGECRKAGGSRPGSLSARREAETTPPRLR